jgi:5'-nucleotidase
MKRKTTLLLLVIMLLVSLTTAGSAAANGHTYPGDPERVDFWLTVLHNNDGESDLINLGVGLEDFGGAARFKTVVENLKWSSIHGPPSQPGAKRGMILVSSGDNFLAGPEFNASQEKGVPFYDTIAMDLIGYDAVTIGNHDFDFGPDILADFIEGYIYTAPPYMSANLIYEGEPRLQALFDQGRIARSIVVKERGEEIGIIGATTPNLRFISSPRNVEVIEDVAAVVQAEVDKLEAMGINKIIFISHLQDINGDIALANQINGLDVMVAGGGDELLANPGDLLIPGDEGEVFGPYPMTAIGADGTEIPVVTTSGQYGYVGQLVVGFDKWGNVIELDEDLSGPYRVAGDDCGGTFPCDDAVKPDPMVQALVTDSVAAYVDDLANNIIGTSVYDLDGRRSSVRSKEANEGNLIADALFWQSTQLAVDFGVAAPDVALQNGGGIRNDSIVPAGPISQLTTFSMVPFPNFVTVLENIPRSQFKEIMENAVSRTQPGDTPGGTGRFAQIAGFTMVWSGSGIAQVLNPDGTVATPGTRVQEITLDDGTVIVAGGSVVAGPDLTVATIDFLARGGDEYPYRGAPFVTLGVTYQQALANYIVDGLGGTINGPDYMFDVNNRNFEIP